MLKLATWQHDLVTDIGDWCDSARELYGVLDENPSRESFLRAVHPDDCEALSEVLRSALSGPGERTVTHRHRVVLGSGEVRWLETRLRVDRDEAGAPVRLVGASIDRTANEHAEEALRAEGVPSRWFGEHGTDAIFIADWRGRYVEVNESACDLLGYSRDELLSTTIWDLLHPDDLRADPPRLDKIVADAVVRRDRRLRHKNGSFVNVEVSVRRLADGRLCEITRDVSRRVAAERALHESEQTLRELGANLPALLWVREASGRLLYANDGWAALLGKPPVIGEHYSQLAERMDPEDRARLAASAQQALEGEYEELVRFVDPAGTVLWFRLCGFAIRDADGKPYRVAGFAINVTEQRATEERIRASLREKESLLREIHHRVKNNLQVVSSLLRLQAAKAEAPFVSALLDESQSRVASMALVHDMLHQSSDLSRIPFGSYARALAKSLAFTFGVAAENVTLVVDAGDLALTVDMAVSCGLLLNEILSNSFKHAYPGGARGTIRVALHLVQEQHFRLLVSDDGVGLPVDFEARGRSSLGTKLIESLVEQIGGTMTRTSSGVGTAYEILFRPEPDERRSRTL